MTYGKQAFTLFGSPELSKRLSICQTAHAKTTSFTTSHQDHLRGIRFDFEFLPFFQHLGWLSDILIVFQSHTKANKRKFTFCNNLRFARRFYPSFLFSIM